MKKDSTSNTQKIALILNIVLAALEFIAIILCINDGGFYNFVYYTVLSNTLTMISCACYAYYYITMEDGGIIPKWVRQFRYMTSNCLFLTFFIAYTVLVPMGYPDLVYNLLVRGPNVFHHTVCPILSIISFCRYEEDELDNKDLLIAASPTLLYAIVFTTLNIVRVVDGPYPFLQVHNQPVIASVMWFIAILLVSCLLAWIIKYLSKKLYKNPNKSIPESEELV